MQKITSVALPSDLTDDIDQVADDFERSRSFVVRRLLEHSLTGAQRLAALKAVSDEGLREYAANARRERPRNPGEIIAASSAEGHARLRAHNEIAKGAK
jgi:predicted transcriptional regulator